VKERWVVILKALVTKRSIVIASVAFFLALITVISINVFNSAGPVTGFANTVTRPVRALASTVARTFEEIYSAIYRYRDLERRNEELLILLTRYEQDFRVSAALAEENAQLRQLFEFRERHPDYQQEMVTLVSWNSDNWSSSFIINRGYMNSNIVRGMGVATEYGVLLGQVFEVSATTSTVITVLDTTFSAAGFVGRGDGGDDEGSVTVKGDFTQMRNGLLMLDNINDDLVVRSGDMVVTSGHGGVFPTGLIVGEVVDVYRHTSGIGRFATVRPMREIDTISTMFVITDFENPD
jgi:rod shape-determining protein MreC